MASKIVSGLTEELHAVEETFQEVTMTGWVG